MLYHMFTNDADEYTTNLLEANKIFNEFVEEWGCARLYEKQNENDEGDCISSHGVYPR